MADNILTKRGKEKFTHNGFLYVFDKASKADSELKYWRCEQKNRCKARLHTKAGEVVLELNSHSHEACAAEVEVALVKTKIKKRAEETLEPPTVVVNECLTDMSQASLAAVPNMSALSKITPQTLSSQRPSSYFSQHSLSASFLNTPYETHPSLSATAFHPLPTTQCHLHNVSSHTFAITD